MDTHECNPNYKFLHISVSIQVLPPSKIQGSLETVLFHARHGQLTCSTKFNNLPLKRDPIPTGKDPLPLTYFQGKPLFFRGLDGWKNMFSYQVQLFRLCSLDYHFFSSQVSLIWVNRILSPYVSNLQEYSAKVKSQSPIKNWAGRGSFPFDMRSLEKG